MNIIIHLLLGLLVALAAAVSLYRLTHPPQPRLRAINEAGTHESARITRISQSALTEPYLVVKAGSLPGTVAIGDAASEPVGIGQDRCEANDRLGIQYLGGTEGTVLVQATGTVVDHAKVAAAAAGRVQQLPVSAGTYWVLGLSVSVTGASGGRLEIVPCRPYQVTVA